MRETLPDLPPSSSEYWKYSEMEVREMQKGLKHEHRFEQRTSREIQCECGAGFFIGIGDKVIDGHLYHNDKLVI